MLKFSYCKCLHLNGRLSSKVPVQNPAVRKICGYSKNNIQFTVYYYHMLQSGTSFYICAHVTIKYFVNLFSSYFVSTFTVIGITMTILICVAYSLGM